MRISLATATDRESIDRTERALYDRRMTVSRIASSARAITEHRGDVIIAIEKEAISGYAVITGPTGESYPLERYFRREELPLAFDGGLYEVQIIALAPDRDGGSQPALSLAYAALRLVENRGGTHLVATGRVDLIPFYRKIGLVPLELRLLSGDTELELMHAAVTVLRRRSGAISEQIDRLRSTLDWAMPISFEPESGAESHA